MPNTTTRLLQLLSLLQTQRDWPGPVLAERLSTSARTIRRDIDRLREMGYNIGATLGPDGGYRLQAGNDLPPLLFDEDQSVAIAVALQTMSESGVHVGDAAERALTTLRRVMPSHLRHRLDTMRVIDVAAGPTKVPRSDVQPDVLVEIARAIAAQEVLRFDYLPIGETSVDGAAVRRRIEPHHVVAVEARWYLVGWDLDRDDWRVYRADRVAPRMPTGPRFARRAVPGGSLEAFIAARFTGSESGRWACWGSIVLDLPARSVIPFVGDGTVRALEADRCVVEAGSWSWVALAAAFGRFDAAISEVQPAELAQAFATLAERYVHAASR